jgi:hypothetical protein
MRELPRLLLVLAVLVSFARAADEDANLAATSATSPRHADTRSAILWLQS